MSPPPCVLHEDEHILAIHKPAGLNTHAPNPWAGEGIHEWLKNREPRWSRLAIIHRLDKATSGVMVFGKTPEANRSLTDQFARRQAAKTYLFLTDRKPASGRFTVRTGIERLGERYIPKALPSGAALAETEFESLGKTGNYHLLAARPLTGRTHQIRVHAAHEKLPILGDELYGGAPFPRVCLHARELVIRHPATGAPLKIEAEHDFFEDPALALRELLIHPRETNAFRLAHGEADGWPGASLDRWGDCLLLESDREPDDSRLRKLLALARKTRATGAYFKLLNRQVRQTTAEEAAPRLLFGEPAPEAFEVFENGVRYEISFGQGYSVGLFLDQRDNRRRLLGNYATAGFPLFPEGLAGKDLLNTFAYTCGFSVCAALAGAKTVSLDLSKKYLDWGRRNFRLNGIALEPHDFIFGDVFDWVRRFQKRGRRFDLIILDPPTFSHAKGGTLFQAEKHYGKLIAAVLPLLRPGGILFASTNAHKLPPDEFVTQVETVVRHHKRRVLQRHFAPQPPDFPAHKNTPAHLKTVWMRLS